MKTTKISQFIEKHKIISFLVVITFTILTTRILTYLIDPNIIIRGFEIHHFHYGLILLIIISLFMLFERGNFKLNLLITAISLGLIADEFLFIGTKTRGPLEYSSTLAFAIILTIIILLIIEFIFYVFDKRKK